MKAASTFETIPTDSIKKETVRLIISFGSICCGINHEKHIELVKFISQYKKNIHYTEHHWGDEGEFDYCFPLKELSKKEQAEFIRKIKKVIGNERTVGLYENTTCPR